MNTTEARSEERQLEAQRSELVQRLDDWLETPMLVLAGAWLVLLIGELVWGQSPWFETLGMAIWIAFIIEFSARFLLAPRKLAFLARNWLSAIALLLPALRVFRIFRALRVLRLARTTRALRLLRIFTSLNRGMRAMGASLSRRGFGYVVGLTLIVMFVGAAGMYHFEGAAAMKNRGLHSYGEALWWTAMIITTMGSEYWPQTTEGRVLCFVLALYSFTIFGYLTATLATYFIGRDAENDAGEIAGEKSLAAIQLSIASLEVGLADLRKEWQALSRRLEE